MNARPVSHLLKYAAIFSIGICCPLAVLAQGFMAEATYSPNFALVAPAVKVGEKFYDARLYYQNQAWVLTGATSIHPIDSGYLTGSYDNGVLDLACVNVNGERYSARFVNTATEGYSFRLSSFVKLDACPMPAGIGPARRQWVRTADSPLSARNHAVIAWNGDEVVVFGGLEYYCPSLASCIAPRNPPYTDGAAYNPLTDTWRKIADVPAAINGNDTVTIGKDIFLLARSITAEPTTILLRYRFAQNRWEQSELPERPVAATIAAYGNHVLLYSFTEERGSTGDWLFDTASGQWSPLPADPFGPGYSRRYLAVGSDLYLFDRAIPASPGGGAGPSYLRTARLRGQQWQVLPASNHIGSAPSLVAGRRLIAPQLGCADGGSVNGYGRCVPYGAVFNTETDTWQDLPNAPGRGIKYFPSGGGFSSNDLELLTPGRPALDATTNEWFLVPALDANPNIQRSMQATGPYGFAFGGASAMDVMLKDSWIWKP